jgi:hypothetical protein
MNLKELDSGWMNESREVGPIWGKKKWMEWTQEVGHSQKNGNGWNIGRLDTDDEHGKVGQFNEVVWRV